MKDLKILNLNDLYLYQCASTTYDIVNNHCPEALRNTLRPTADRNEYSLRSRARNPLELEVPHVRSTRKKRFFSECQIIWNEIPNEIKSIERRSLFKKKLKKYFLDKYCTEVECTNPLCSDRRFHRP